MNLIRKLGWFFKLERKRYIIGILALSLVSVFNLIPPRVIGVVIDRIASRNLTSNQLVLNLSVIYFWYSKSFGKTVAFSAF